MNRIHLLGALTRDPEILALGQKPIAVLDLATEDSYRDPTHGGRTTRQTRHTVVVRREGTVRAVPNLKAGSRVMVEGALRYELFEGDELKDRDTAKIFVEAPAHRVIFLD